MADTFGLNTIIEVLDCHTWLFLSKNVTKEYPRPFNTSGIICASLARTYKYVSGNLFASLILALTLSALSNCDRLDIDMMYDLGE
jgi:hypothetical protein